MQLNIDVLPAPFGPINAVIEPGLTPNDTSLMAFRPPKDSDSPSTSRRAGFIGARIDTLQQTPDRRLSGLLRQPGSSLLPSPLPTQPPRAKGTYKYEAPGESFGNILSTGSSMSRPARSNPFFQSRTWRNIHVRARSTSRALIASMI